MNISIMKILFEFFKEHVDSHSNHLHNADSLDSY